MKVSGVIFEGRAGTFFVSDSQTLMYKWNEKLKLWCYISGSVMAFTEDYVKSVHNGPVFDAYVDIRKLASGIRAK